MSAKSNEAFFISHCDNESCDLGSFQTECPCCEKNIVNYEIWWKQDEMFLGKTIDFECTKCKTLLTAAYNNEEYEFFVKIKENGSINL